MGTDRSLTRLAAVWVSPTKFTSWGYAVGYPDRTGTLYRVRPIGQVKPGAGQISGDEFCCLRAEVAEVIGQPWNAPTDAWWRIDEKIYAALALAAQLQLRAHESETAAAEARAAVISLVTTAPRLLALLGLDREVGAILGGSSAATAEKAA